MPLSFVEVQMLGLVECNHLVARRTRPTKSILQKRENRTQVRDNAEETLWVMSPWG